MTTLNPEVFEEAAKMVERDGWWSATGGGNGVCISNAVSFASDGNPLYQEALMASLDVDSPVQLFALNDRQHVRDGKRWAIENLREVAKKIREGEL